jgi:hypothetical protein
MTIIGPNMVVCAMIFNALDVPEEVEDVWTEEFPGGRTLNVVWLVEPRNRRPAICTTGKSQIAANLTRLLIKAIAAQAAARFACSL